MTAHTPLHTAGLYYVIYRVLLKDHRHLAFFLFPARKTPGHIFWTDVFPQAIIPRTSTSNNMVQNRKKIPGSIKNNYILHWKQASPACVLFFSWSGDTHDDGVQFNYSLFAMRTFRIIQFLPIFLRPLSHGFSFWLHDITCIFQGKNPHTFIALYNFRKKIISIRVSSP